MYIQNASMNYLLPEKRDYVSCLAPTVFLNISVRKRQ